MLKATLLKLNDLKRNKHKLLYINITVKSIYNLLQISRLMSNILKRLKDKSFKYVLLVRNGGLKHKEYNI